MSHDEAGLLWVEHVGHVLLLRLNRPEKRNAVNAALAAELAEVMQDAAADAAVRVAVLTGTGTAFCAGADLADSGPPAPGETLAGMSRRLTAPLDAFAKPIVAAVNGLAYGGGCELVLSADLRVAAASATFCLPEVRIGSMPGSGGTQRLLHAVGSAVAAKLLFTGDPIDAQEAQRAGLVSDVVADDVLLEHAMGIAQRIAERAPLSTLAVKRALRTAAADTRTAAGMELERMLWALLATTADRAEGRGGGGGPPPAAFRRPVTSCGCCPDRPRSGPPTGARAASNRAAERDE